MYLPLDEFLGGLYRTFGPPKAMGESAPAADRPHFFLHRNFLGEQDLAILFNTKRCRYQCKFCALPFKSSGEWIPEEEVLAQFRYVLEEDRHALGVLERITIANEGSVFDETTFPAEALTQIIAAIRRLPRVRKIVLETRLEFLRAERLRAIAEKAASSSISLRALRPSTRICASGCSANVSRWRCSSAASTWWPRPAVS